MPIAIRQPAYNLFLDFLKDVIRSENINDMSGKLENFVRMTHPEARLFAAVNNQYENELEIFYPSENENSTDIKELMHFMMEKNFTKFQGNYSEIGFREIPFFTSDRFIIYGSCNIENGIFCAILASYPMDSDIKTIVEFSDLIFPTIWSVFIERYNRMMESRESEIFWKIRSAQHNDSDSSLNIIELNQLLENLLEIAMRKMKLRCGCIMLLNEATGELEFEPRAIRGKSLVTPSAAKLSLKTCRSIASIVISENRPYICNDTENDENYYPFFHGTKSDLIVPIEFQKRAIGLIDLESPEKNFFTQEDAAEISALAGEATMFIRRAQLFKESSEKGNAIMIMGTSQQWKTLEKRIEKASNTDATVMLRGESGTGKELLAHAIHFNSKRKNGAFVTINCAAIPEELLESEMFGHVKGAFTGAYYNKIGEFERADGGTIFLDEIGDLPLMLQVKLLRTLQSGEIRPVGSDKGTKKVDVRVIAATSRNLEAMMKEGKFRMDIYYRLHVVPIHIPPLREYKSDIPQLASNFLKGANLAYQTNVTKIDDAAMKILMNYDYPGNVRQLKNFINQAAIMSDDQIITPDDLPSEIFRDTTSETHDVDFMPRAGETYAEAKERILEQFSVSYFSDLLKQSGGNHALAAKKAGISRVALYKILSKYGLDKNAAEFQS